MAYLSSDISGRLTVRNMVTDKKMIFDSVSDYSF